MIDRDSVLRYAATAAENHADEVSRALTVYLNAETPEALNFAERRLRATLVTLSEGFEGSAHDGSTFKARVNAAKRGLAAWDGA